MANFGYSFMLVGYYDDGTKFIGMANLKAWLASTPPIKGSD
jgi:hypothetical protein